MRQTNVRKMKIAQWVLAVMMMMTLAAKAQTANHHLEVAKNLDIFNALYSNIDLMYVDTLNPAQTMTAAINGMLDSLDPYTEYYPEEDKKKLEMLLTGKYAGIGALVKYHQALGRVVIDEPYQGMPAAEVGLRKGDIILAIDDSVMTDKKVDYVSSRLRGDAGTSFVLKIHRPSAKKDMKFKITRRNIKMPEIPYWGMVTDSVGYIGLSQFTEGCAKLVRRAFVDLKKQGAQKLIFDLRNNGGGSEMEAVDIVNIWVPQGITVVENKGKVKQANHAYQTRLEPVDTVMPIVVMVNSNTASASEITSGALQDLDRAVVVGTRTYGKGLVQVPLDLPYNTNVKITTAHYYIPSGRCIQAVNYKRGSNEVVADSLTKVFHTRGGREVRDGGGIKPDVEVKTDTMTTLVYYLAGNGLDSTEVTFDYIRDYIDRHPTIAPAASFHLTEQDWQEFRQRVLDSGFSYDPLSSKQLDDLKKTARFEGYYDDAKEEFDRLEEKLSHNVAKELDLKRESITEMLENEIITAYYYQAGVIEASLKRDKQTAEALRILKNDNEYRKILHPGKE